jgi:hypothetical protein
MADMDDTTRREVLGEALMEELKAIREYVEGVPVIRDDVHQIKATVDEINQRLAVVETVVRDHEREIRSLGRKAA